MFLELHDLDGYPMLVCIDDIQRVCRGEAGGSEVYMNEHEDPVEVQDSVAVIKELIAKAGGVVAAMSRVDVGAGPIRLQPLDGPRSKD